MSIKSLIVDKNNPNSPIVFFPIVHGDDRGVFFETYKKEDYDEVFKSAGMGNVDFVQDNQSISKKGVVRGLHFQNPPYEQAKLVRVTSGSIIDVAACIDPSNPMYGKWYFEYLSDINHREFFIPRGYAHGFVALENNTVLEYKCDNVYKKDSEGAISIYDDTFNIPWERFFEGTLLRSPKDILAPFLKTCREPQL